VTHLLRKLSLALVSATILTVPALSHADSAAAVNPARSLNLTDLDLAAPGGNAALYRLLTARSVAVCKDAQDRLPGEDETRCRDRELASAASRIDISTSSQSSSAYQPLAFGPPSPPTIRIIKIPLG
jgi:UrcA family protein